MNKILIFMLSILVGSILPASAGINVDVPINTGIGIQTQILVPISIGVLGSGGNQNIVQGQIASICQSNEAYSQFTNTHVQIC